MFKALFQRRPAFPETVVVAGRSVPLAVREHATARRLILRLTPCGTALQLTVPRRTSARTVAAFLERHSGWAEARLRPAPRIVPVRDGILLPFRGRPLLVRHDPRRRGTALFDEPEGQPVRLLVGGEAAHLGRRVRDALRREARSDLEAAVERHARRVGIRPSGISLKDTTSRWGSCSAGRRLSFSWRIVMAPPFVLDYLAAHETAHLAEMNHGPAFWALCRELCPDMDEGRKWLRREGASLHLFDFGPPADALPAGAEA